MNHIEALRKIVDEMRDTASQHWCKGTLQGLRFLEYASRLQSIIERMEKVQDSMRTQASLIREDSPRSTIAAMLDRYADGLYE